MPVRKFATQLGLCLLVIGLLGGLVIVYSQDDLLIGYGIIRPDEDAPVAVALFSGRNDDGVLLWEAAVGAVEPIQRGRIFLDQSDGTRTAFAIMNPSENELLSLTYRVSDSSGIEINTCAEMVEPGHHFPRFVDELCEEVFRDIGNLIGSLTIEAGQGQTFAAVTLRESRNFRGEAVFATLPVLDLDSPMPIDDTGGELDRSIVFPHLGAGEGLSTQVVLINAVGEVLQGQIKLFSGDGSPLILMLDGEEGSEFPFLLESHGTYRGELTSSSTVKSGYALVTVDQGNFLPSGAAIFRLEKEGAVESEAGVLAAIPTDRVRIFVDMLGTRSGVAVAPVEDPDALIKFDIKDLAGTLVDTRSTSISEQGSHARFADELFPELPEEFRGVMEISSEALMAVVTLKLTVNELGDQILTTLPVASVRDSFPSDLLILPQLGSGSGFSTELILLNGLGEGSLGGSIQFFRSDGTPMQPPIGLGQEEIRYEAPSSGAVHLSEGCPAADILLEDEYNLEEGTSISIDSLVVDANGQRVDCRLDVESTNLEVAEVEAGANGTVELRGKIGGFSTLIVEVGNVRKTATITVPGVTSGRAGFDFDDVDADRGGRVYLADSSNHSIFLANTIGAEPGLYAGVFQQEGDDDAKRLEAKFNRPSFVALDWNSNVLYVSDSSNGSVRRVDPGPEGEVGTLELIFDNPLKDGFNDPQGLALDEEGFLWVVESGSHTILRVDLVDNSVENVAGKEGMCGFRDGIGSEAQLCFPKGIAVEQEPIVRKIERVASREPPPPVSVVVADTDNNRIRRITKESRDPDAPWIVETIRGRQQAASSRRSGGRRIELERDRPILNQESGELVFDSPDGISVDPFGNIFVSDTEGNRIEVILPTGKVVPAVPEATSNEPKGIAVATTGEILVSEKDQGVREIDYGNPQILQIVPDSSDTAGEMITLHGRNFGPESEVLLDKDVIEGAEVLDSETISLVNPGVPINDVLVSVQNRGGLALVSPSLLGCGNLVSGEITQPAETKTHTFLAFRGSVVTLTLVETPDWGGSGGRNDARATLFSPSGQNMLVMESNSQEEVTLPESGLYTLRINANNLVSTGSYNFGLECLQPLDAVDDTLACGGLVLGSIEESGEVDLITFDGTLDRVVTLTLVETPDWGGSGGRNDARATLFSPSGQNILVVDSNSQEEVTLPESGLYTLRINANNLVSTGSYNLGLECLQPLDAVDDTLACGRLVSGSIEESGKVDLITFNGAMDGVVTLTLVETPDWGGSGGRNDARATLFSPSGQNILVMDSNSQEEVTLPESGLYTLRINANNLVSTGSYNLGLECLQPLDAVDDTLACGGLVSGSIEESGKVDLITFDSTLDTVVTLTLVETPDWGGSGGRNDARATLFSPSGQNMLVMDSNSQEEVTLPESGLYTLRINANNLVSRGSYNLGLECLQPLDAVDDTLACGRLVSGSIEESGKVDLITFNGAMDGVVTLTLVETPDWGGSGGRNDARATLFSPSGQNILVMDSNSQEEVTLPESGLYTLRINANNLVSTGSYNLGLECLQPLDAVDDTLACGGLVSGSIEESGEVHLITFDGTLDRVVTLTLVETPDWGGSGGRNDARATLFSPSGAKLLTIDSNDQQEATLPESGTYTLRVNANNLVSTGSYNLGLECR